MKINKDEIKRVEKYQELKEELKLLKEDYRQILLNSVGTSDGWGHKSLNGSYGKVLRIYIMRRMKNLKRKIKEMEE